MNAKRFIYRVLTITGIVVVSLVAINYLVDMYGLFGSSKGRSISIYSDERTSKYLLAHRYVPENFDAYILGPSLSANLNPKEVAGYRIYNLSMMGANITEEKAVVEKAMERRKPAFVILCLHPYLTVDHGLKTGMISPKEYYGALGSISLYKAYVLRIIRQYDLLPAKYPRDQFNDAGFNNYEAILKKVAVEEKINEQLNLENAIDATIDPVAWEEFEQMVGEFERSKTRIIAYFHPLPRPLFIKYEESLSRYQKQVSDALKDRAVVLDFNDESYEFFTEDFSNYMDHGHLSDKGQRFLLNEIIKKSGLN